MDAQVIPNVRRLTRDAPPSSLKENMSSSRSLRSQSSGTLRRNPSAPTYPQLSSRNPGDNPRTQSTYTSSNSSLERPSPSVASSEFGSQGQSSPYNPSHQYARRSLIERNSDELIGAPFDAPGLSKIVDHTKASGFQNSLRRPPPPPLSHTSPDPRMLTTPLRQSASFSAGDRTIETTPTRSETGFSVSKRYSDEANGNKGRWRKKSGISQIFNTVLGSSRNVKISAPENPIHVTHVGYDNETGQFTVRLLCSLFCPLVNASVCITLFSYLVHIRKMVDGHLLRLCRVCLKNGFRCSSRTELLSRSRSKIHKQLWTL